MVLILKSPSPSQSLILAALPTFDLTDFPTKLHSNFDHPQDYNLTGSLPIQTVAPSLPYTITSSHSDHSTLATHLTPCTFSVKDICAKMPWASSATEFHGQELMERNWHCLFSMLGYLNPPCRLLRIDKPENTVQAQWTACL